MDIQQIIAAALLRNLTEPDATNQLDDLQVRGAFDFEEGTYIGYDYKNQVWIEAGLPERNEDWKTSACER